MLARFVNSLPTGISQQITRLYFQALVYNQRGAHSKPEHHNYMAMEVKILPALQDNYMYLIMCKTSKEAAIVDPVEPAKVLEEVKQLGAKLTSVYTTHHHWDHAGGNDELVKLHPGLKVYGGDTRIGSLTDKVIHNQKIQLGELMVECLFTPCHTAGHICYYVTANDERKETAVFTGDTLFLGGCGRFFEGTAPQMYTALISILSSLPDDTKVFCGHEYTLQNLKFAAFVEPQNENVAKKMEWSLARREKKEPTVPSTIGEEKSYNPFMRVMVPEVMGHAGKSCAIETMQVIRQEKDNFKA